MAGSFGSNDDELVSGINVTPLVDVVLVLLVIFLMTAPVIYQSSIQVQLPQAKSGNTQEKTPLSFAISKEGDVYWDKDKLDWESLAARLKTFGESISTQTAVISADKATPHGTVVQLMDVLRQAGLSKFALNVESK